MMSTVPDEEENMEELQEDENEQDLVVLDPEHVSPSILPCPHILCFILSIATYGQSSNSHKGPTEQTERESRNRTTRKCMCVL